MEFPNWVAGHLTGGIGNRLFQHAAAAGLSEKWGMPLVFYLPDCEPTNHGPFENIFKLFPTIPKLTKNVSIQRLPEERGGTFVYTPFPEKPSSSYVTVDGWRQTELYFPKHGIFPDFDSAIVKERRDALLKQYGLEGEGERNNTWFLHVRLGDYKVLPHHQIDLNGYYPEAVKQIPKDARVLLFSDELEAFGSQLIDFLKQMGLTPILANISDELEALYVMSRCWGGAVVANSTFSWWGAYFARKHHPNPRAYVAVYPSKWGNGLPEAKDVVPPWGIAIQNK
jgi:hypothetical protein